MHCNWGGLNRVPCSGVSGSNHIDATVSKPRALIVSGLAITAICALTIALAGVPVGGAAFYSLLAGGGVGMAMMVCGVCKHCRASDEENDVLAGPEDHFLPPCTSSFLPPEELRRPSMYHTDRYTDHIRSDQTYYYTFEQEAPKKDPELDSALSDVQYDLDRGYQVFINGSPITHSEECRELPLSVVTCLQQGTFKEAFNILNWRYCPMVNDRPNEMLSITETAKMVIEATNQDGKWIVKGKMMFALSKMNDKPDPLTGVHNHEDCLYLSTTTEIDIESRTARTSWNESLTPFTVS